MVNTKLVLFAILALSLLLSGAETRKVEWPQSESNRMCCRNQPQFGTCDTNQAAERCSKMCLRGCRKNKGGGCQPINTPPGSVCRCYC